ncbi:uncharacterized protein [Lepeophtheirus salmonis]|uniref:uncharacterized protein n=1 Tax=Lepeophtheirus salmonis TaxID=72036 RepID=UPI001AE1F8B0|nr:zinc finger protein 385B-like [Lepeophtheirus salmonis]
MSLLSSTEKGCQCHIQLDPVPKGSSSWRNGSDASLDHYCHVCNTQLNSCKQTRIHVNGKRHEKRLIYLKYALECEESPSDSPPNENAAPEYTVPYYHYEPYVLPSYEPSGSYYYSPPPAIVQQSGYYDYHATVPPPVVLSHPSPPQSIVTIAPPIQQQQPLTSHQHSYSSITNNSNHGVMSPSLTSGFSGSGADCKSTETSSILSAASFNSNPGPILSSPSVKNNGNKKGNAHHHKSNRNLKKNQAAKKFAEEEAAKESLLKTLHKLVGKGLTCEVCQIAFPSKTVLENHLKGSRHNRKVKSREVFRELQDAGAEFRQNDEEISCEVCKVSVNSSHQLQAHLAGQKHKVRCYRRGLHPSKALISEFSSLEGGNESEDVSSSSSSSSSCSHSLPQAPLLPPSALEPPPLRLSLLGHPGSLKADVTTSLMGAPPMPSCSTTTTTINLPVMMNNRKSSSSCKSSKSSCSSRQKTSQKQKSESEDKKVLNSDGGTVSECSNVDDHEHDNEESILLSSPDISPISSLEEPEKSKMSNTNNNSSSSSSSSNSMSSSSSLSSSSSSSSSSESMNNNNNIKSIISFKCESCQVTMASQAPTPVS